ncbi:MAG TPA: universal stress protein [Anaerolineae bacterium]|nr:universal stress protein [Anaerolineae bacterium]
MFDRILIPIDNSSESWVAAHHAIAIAQEEGARLIGLFIAEEKIISAPFLTSVDVMDPLSPSYDPMLMKQTEFLREQLRELGEKALRDLRQQATTAGVEIETYFESGVVFEIILEYAREVDLIVMGRRGVGGKWLGPLFGSTFEAVVRQAPCPVLATVSDPRPLHTMLVAYDGSDRAKDALEIGLHMALERDRRLILLTVDDGKEDRAAASFEAAAMAREQGIAAERRFVKGHVAEQILKVTAEEDVDLILLGAYGHSRFLSAILGSTVDDVIHKAPVPVMVCQRQK